MIVEQTAKSVQGFLSILTKKFQLLMVLALGIAVFVIWLTLQVKLEVMWKAGAIFFVILMLTVLLYFLSGFALKEEKEREIFTVKLQKEMELERERRNAIAEARKRIREWKTISPSETEEGIHPFGDGVDLECKEMPNGTYCAILHLKNEIPKEYPLKR